MKKLFPYALPLILLVVVLSEVTVNATNWLSFFEPDLSKAPSFSDSKLYLFEGISGYADDVGLFQINGTIEAFGDFNSDQ